MKPPVLIATAAALAGFAFGWLLKPSGPKPADTPALASDANESRRRPGPLETKSRLRDERPLVLKARGAEVNIEEMEADLETVSAHVNFERLFGDATERAEGARLNRLAEALGLSSEQKDSLGVMMANRRDGFRSMKGIGQTPSEMVEQAASAERRFEEDARKILDPEQVEALEALREREKENDIEAGTQRDLADLIGQVDLSPTQRDQALELLRAGNIESAAKRPEGWSLINESMNMMGGNYVSILEEMGEFMGDAGAMNDPREFQRRLIEARHAEMDRKVKALSSILTPGQLAQYRANLNSRISVLEQAPPPPVIDRR